MVGVFGLDIAVSTVLAFLFGIVLGVVIGIVARVEYRSWTESRSKRKQRISEHVLQPLYDELSAAAEGNLPRDGTDYRSHWDSLAAHQRRHVGNALRTDLNDYSERLKRVNLLDSELANIQTLRQSLPYGMLERRGVDRGTTAYLTTPAGADEENELPVEDFLVEYGSLIETSTSAEELHRRLAGTTLEPFVSAWDAEYPGWEASFWTAFAEDGAAILETAKERQQLLETDIPDQAARIRDALEDRLDSRRSTGVLAQT